jgi:hypothetical protein
MFNYQETLQAMKAQRASLQQELDRLDKAIAALASLVGNASLSRAAAKSAVQRKQGQSAKPKKVNKARPKISAQGLRNIVEAQKKRWAKVRAAANAKAKAANGK